MAIFSQTQVAVFHKLHINYTLEKNIINTGLYKIFIFYLHNEDQSLSFLLRK